MTLQLASASHLDHHLTTAHIAFILALFVDRDGFFAETVTLPSELPDLDCALYGPLAGDAPVSEIEISYAVRPSRRCASRLIALPSRPTRLLTVIAGSHEDGRPCVLWTAYGGPSAPREPGDLSLPDWASVLESRLFWMKHALAGV